MSTNSLEQLKQAKSTLQAERRPVSQVQDAVKETKKITQFVNVALSQENRWIFQAGEQESIVLMLEDITRTNKELYNKCRTPDHFDRDANRFLKMKNQIIRQAECIHFSLDQGFYNTEPRGFSAGKAIELSLKQIRKIRDGHQQGKWAQLPIEANVDDSAKNEVEKIFTEATLLAEKLLKYNNISRFDPPMAVEEVQSVYKFFQNVHQIQDLEWQALIDALSKKTTANHFSPNEILDKLSSFERRLKNIRIPTSKNFPEWGLELYEMSRTDITLRMHLLRIPFEPLGFINGHLKKLEEQKESDGIEKSIISFHDRAIEELKHQQLFVETFGGIHETLREVTGILQNLSICFGKIYHNASSDSLETVFLVKALGLIKGMLEKGERVAASKNQTLQKIRQSVNEVNLFDAPIAKGILHALELLEQGKKEMNQYCNRIGKFLDILSSASDWDSMKTYSLLQEAYDENASLTSASMIIDSVAQTCVLLVKTIKEVESKWTELGKIREQNQNATTLYEQTVAFLRQNPEFTEKSLKQSSDQVEELEWILDEMLGQGAQEEIRFFEELRSELKPVRARIKTEEIRETARKSELAGTAEKIEQVPVATKTKAQKTKVQKTKKADKVDPFSKGKKSVYDPFQPFEMVALKKACKSMTSSEGKMIHHVLTNTHTFFTLLNKLESSFISDVSLESELTQDLEKSKTTHEFLNNFARLKFIPHGYYSNNNSPFKYNTEKRKFEVPAGVDKQLKLSENSTGAPMEVYRRLIRVLLGMDDSKTLAAIMPAQILSILEEDFVLKAQDQRVVEEGLQST